MGKRKPAAAPKTVLSRYSFECVFTQPLGYSILTPLDGRSMDAMLLDAGKALALERDERVTITVSRSGGES